MEEGESYCMTDLGRAVNLIHEGLHQLLPVNATTSLAENQGPQHKKMRTDEDLAGKFKEMLTDFKSDLKPEEVDLLFMYGLATDQMIDDYARKYLDLKNISDEKRTEIWKQIRSDQNKLIYEKSN